MNQTSIYGKYFCVEFIGGHKELIEGRDIEHIYQRLNNMNRSDYVVAVTEVHP